MIRKFIPIFMLLLLCASNVAAEIAKSPVYSREEGTVAAAVEIKWIFGDRYFIYI